MQNTHRIVIALLAVGILGGVTYVSLNHKDNPDLALLNGFANMYVPHDAKDVYDFTGIEHDAGTSDAGKKLLSFHMEGVSNHALLFADRKVDATIGLKANPIEELNIDMEAQLRVVDGVIYGRISKMPEAPTIPEEAKLVTNLWFGADPIALAKKLGDEKVIKAFDNAIGSGAEAYRKEAMEKISSAYHAHPFLTNAAYTGGGEVGESKVRTITFSVDKNVLADFILDINTYLLEKAQTASQETIPNTLTRADIMDVLNDITITESSAKVGISDKRIHALTLKTNISDDSDGSTGELTFTFSSENLKTPLVVTKPDSFLPVDQILAMSLAAAKSKAEAAKQMGQSTGGSRLKNGVDKDGIMHFGPAVFDLNAGDDAVDAGDYTTAIKLYTKVINGGTLPDIQLSVAYGKRGKARFESGDNRGALGDLNKAIALNPTDGESHYYRARTEASLGLTTAMCTDLGGIGEYASQKYSAEIGRMNDLCQ